MRNNKKIILFFIVALIILASIIFVSQNGKITTVDNPQNNENNNEQNTDNNSNDEIVEDIPSTSADFTEIVWGNRDKNQVIFTFDGGAGIQSLQLILDALAKYKVKGTFFITGKWAENNYDLVKQISDAGHEIFNHTYSHPHLTELTNEQISEELNKTEEIISAITGKTTKPFFRAPFGERDSRVLEATKNAGYRSVYWTVDALDWKETEGVTAEQVKDRVLDGIAPGTIYLMHIGDNITGQALDGLFSQIIAQDYNIVSLTQGIE